MQRDLERYQQRATVTPQAPRGLEQARHKVPAGTWSASTHFWMLRALTFCKQPIAVSPLAESSQANSLLVLQQ